MITTTQSTEKQQSNSLVFKTQKTIGEETICVAIRLNDECKNGHQDFSITGDIYKAGVAKIDKNWIMGGCIHEKIEKYFPEFITFIKLHLCDYKGIPTHPSANMRYFLKEGFNKIKPNDPNFKTEYCDYYNITFIQFDAIKNCENDTQMAMALKSNGILKQWEAQATEAIRQLEKLTDTKFIVDSKRLQFVEPTTEEIEKEENKQRSGYYTVEARQEREEQKRQSFFTKLEEERQKKLSEINLEYAVKKIVLEAGGYKALDNCIFYNHTKQLAFNWKGYNNLSEEDINSIIEKLILPDGVTIENKNK